MNKLENLLIVLGSVLGISISVEDFKNFLGIIILVVQIILIIIKVVSKVINGSKNKNLNQIIDEIIEEVKDKDEKI